MVCLWHAPTLAQDFHFEGTISRQVLDNYLARAISFTELLHDDLNQPRDRRGVDPRDNMRMILNIKAKFIGRALMLWGHESNLPALLKTAKPFAEALHKAAPDIILVRERLPQFCRRRPAREMVWKRCASGHFPELVGQTCRFAEVTSSTKVLAPRRHDSGTLPGVVSCTRGKVGEKIPIAGHQHRSDFHTWKLRALSASAAAAVSAAAKPAATVEASTKSATACPAENANEFVIIDFCWGGPVRMLVLSLNIYRGFGV
jgi:hypothetical protein